MTTISVTRRQMMSALAFGGASIAVGVGALAGVASASKRIAWIDISLPMAREVYDSLSLLLKQEADALSIQLEINSYFYVYEGEGDRLDHAVARAIDFAPNVFVCLSHHSALLVQKAVPTAEIILVTVLDPTEVGLSRERLACISFDKPHSSRAIDMLSEFPGVRGETIGIVAAAEWLTVGRLKTIQQHANTINTSLEILSAESLNNLQSSPTWNNPSSVSAWWIPESIVLFRNREAIVKQIVSSGRPHVFGRKTSVAKGAMLGLQPHTVDWRQWLLECVVDYLRGTPIERIAYVEVDAWHCFANEQSIASLGIPIPNRVLACIDAFV